MNREKILKWLTIVKNTILSPLAISFSKCRDIILDVGISNDCRQYKNIIQVHLSEEETSLDKVTMLKILKFKMYHEVSHYLWTTMDYEKYADKIYEFWKEEAEKRGLYLYKRVELIAQKIINTMEDGRIENIMVLKKPGIQKIRQWYRANEYLCCYGYDGTESTYDILLGNLHTISTMGLYDKDFEKNFPSGKIRDMVDEMIEPITDFVTCSSLANCEPYVMDIARIFTDAVLEKFSCTQDEFDEWEKQQREYFDNLDEENKRNSENFNGIQPEAENGPISAVLTDEPSENAVDEDELKPDMTIDLRKQKQQQKQQQTKQQTESSNTESNESQDGEGNSSEEQDGSSEQNASGSSNNSDNNQDNGTEQEGNEQGDGSLDNSEQASEDTGFESETQEDESNESSNGESQSCNNENGSNEEDETSNEVGLAGNDTSENDNQDSETSSEGKSQSNDIGTEEQDGENQSMSAEENGNQSDACEESNDSEGSASAQDNQNSSQFQNENCLNNQEENYNYNYPSEEDINNMLNKMVQELSEEQYSELLNEMRKIKKAEEFADKEELKSSDALSNEEVRNIFDSLGYNYPSHVDEKSKIIKRFANSLPEISSRAQKAIQKIRNIIAAKCEEDAREQLEGNLDSTALGRFCMGQTNIYEREGSIVEPDACCMVIKDDSGSMYGDKEKWALEALSEMEEILKPIMPLKMMTFSDNRNEKMKVIKGWNDERNDISYAMSYARSGYSPEGGNDDAFAIAYATTQLEKRSEKDKLLIVISDGCPSSCSKEQVKKAVAMARKKGIFVISFFIGDKRAIDYLWPDFKMMYTNYFCGVEPSRLGDTLCRFIKAFIESSL